MRSQNLAIQKEGKAKTQKASLRKISTQQPPTADEMAKAIKAKEPSPSDIAAILALKMDNSPEEDKAIVLSDTWYEFSVFVEKFNICPATANTWLNNGWLAYSGLGKMRFINKADIEATMRHFRHPAKWTSYLVILFTNSLDFCLDFGGTFF